EELPRRGADVEAVDHDRLALAADDRVRERRAQRPRLLDLGAAERAPVAGGERLRDRRARAEDVDDDADAGRRLLGRGEGDVDTHAGTLTRWPPATGIPTARPASRARNAAGRSASTA